MKRLLLIFLLLSVSALAQRTFYIAANGSDSQDGTQKAHTTGTTGPWLHAPGMPNCSATCLAYTWQAGDRFIFRGGDTWHFGINTDSANNPASGGVWNTVNVLPYANNTVDQHCVWGIDTSQCTYFGVDLTWYSGASWARPKLDGDNPPSTSLVSSCTYQVTHTGGAPDVINSIVYAAADTVFDNIELTGLCGQRVGIPSPSIVSDVYFAILPPGTIAGTIILQNVYIHGWSIAQIVAPSITSCTRTSTTATCTTATNHGFSVGDPVVVFQVVSSGATDFTNGGDAALPQTVTSVTSNTFTYTLGNSAGSTSDTGTGGIVSVGVMLRGVTGNTNGLNVLDHFVIDGSDSFAGLMAWGYVPSFYHVRDSIFRYVADGVGQDCHDVHDNIWEFFIAPIVPTHGNIFECNHDAAGNKVNQPQNTPNVFYNNIIRHSETAFSVRGNVGLWLTPNSTPEYWFNNIIYDVGNNANSWAIDWNTDSGGATGNHQYSFNNTLADLFFAPCNSGTQTSMVSYNLHLINTQWASAVGYNCPTQSDPSNISMSDATATSQGYGTTTGRTNTQQTGSLTAVSEATPFAPTLIGNGTVGAGGNYQAYCTALSAYTQEPAISIDAANACKSGTTAGCTYQTSDHTMQCPQQTAVARPLATAWDSGAWQFASGSSATAGISASLLVLKHGNTFTLTWNCTNSTSASISPTVGTVSPTAGGTTSPITMNGTTTYTLTCFSAGGNATAPVTVTQGGMITTSGTIRTANTQVQ